MLKMMSQYSLVEQIVIDKIKFGRYYIIEKEAPEGYKINNEKMYFEITED